MVDQFGDRLREPLPAEIPLKNNARRPLRLQRPSVFFLVPVRRLGIRDQNRRSPAGGDLGDRRRPGAAQHEIGLPICRGHVLNVSQGIRRDRVAPVGIADDLFIRGSRLMSKPEPPFFFSRRGRLSITARLIARAP